MVKGISIYRKSSDVHKEPLKMDHADLVAEMETIKHLSTHERLQLAILRRAQQQIVARQKDNEWLKLQQAKGVNLSTLTDLRTTHHFRRDTTSDKSHISFDNSVVLREALSRNDKQEVAELLEHGITPDAANADGLTALHQCFNDNNVEMLKLLLKYGANVNVQDSNKWTPLHAAAACGHLELVRILIDHGANLLAVNADGNMPYDLCADENTLDYIEAEMSKRGVTQEQIDETRSATERQMLRDLQQVSKNGGDLEQSDEQGATPLHIAAANGYIKVVEFLLEQHVNVNAVDKEMWSPVHAAAHWDHLEVLEMLAQCGADLNIKNKDDETPSDVCKDPEIRERIEHLKAERENKRLSEAQGKRVRRSQTKNTRNSVTSEETRHQEHDVFATVPDSTSVFNNCENGSVLGAANSTTHNNNNNNKNNSHNNNHLMDHLVNTQQPLSTNGLQLPAIMGYNGLMHHHDPSEAATTGVGTTASTTSGSSGGVNKFSGISGDVVNSKKCCTIM
ncbi:protein phosphatase 1 regulatory subunit 16A-like isoform X2 [Musca autumnalis]|uniref:protein phosphatase 1 regulatory subunit 16A-like isoform X2 n=1 Tax=Musca autumnalis TaxID=221902 RepID=UPI003CEBE6D7